MMKLYYTTSVCSLAVRIILHELQIPCEYESVNLKTKVTEHGQNFLTINPKGPVPALQLDNGELLTENAVILQYLADTYHGDMLLPSVGNFARYRVLEWLNFVSTDLHRYCAPLFWSKFSDEIKAEVFLPVLKAKLSFTDQHLQSSLFLMGDHMTLGDSYLFVVLVWLAKLQMNMTEWPHLKRYFETMKTQPSVQCALQEEALSELALAG